jgi:alpha-L-fucosidase
VTIRSLKRLEEELSIYWLEDDIQSVSMLGVDEELEWSFSDDGLTIITPDERPCEHAFVFKIERQ